MSREQKGTTPLRSSTPVRRALPLVAVALTAMLGLAACSGGDAAVPGADPTESAAASTLDEVYQNAVVAEAADILPDSTMAKIKERAAGRRRRTGQS